MCQEFGGVRISLRKRDTVCGEEAALVRGGPERDENPRRKRGVFEAVRAASASWRQSKTR